MLIKHLTIHFTLKKSKHFTIKDSKKNAGVDILQFNVQFCLVTGRPVNANALPESPKPLLWLKHGAR